MPQPAFTTHRSSYLQTKTSAKLFRVVLLIVLASTATAQVATPPLSDPSNIVNFFNTHSAGWLGFMQTYADRLFYLLAGIDLLWTSISLALQGLDLQAWIAGFMRKVLTIGIFLAILQKGPVWMNDIISSFTQLGTTAGGIGAPTPTAILADGLTLGAKLLAVSGAKGMLLDLPSAIGFLAAAAFMVIAFAIMCTQFVKAQIDTYLSLRAAFIFLGFGGSRWTAPYTERYIALCIAAGVRLMVIELFLGFGHYFASNCGCPK